MPSGGDYFGTGFAQGLAQSLQLIPQMLQAKERRAIEKEELGLRKKMLDSQDKLLELKVKELQGKITTQEGMQGLMRQVLGGLGMTAPGGMPAGPEGGAGPAPAGLRGSMLGGGEDVAMEQGADGTFAQAAPPSVGGVPAEQPAAGPAGAAAKMQLNGLNISSTGGISLNIGPKKVNVDFQKIPIGRGFEQIHRIVTDEATGNIISQSPVGAAAPPEFFAKASEAARGFGVDPNSSIGQAVTAQVLAVENLPAEERGAALSKIEQAVGQLPGGGLITGARAQVRGEKLADATATAEASSEAKFKGGGLPEADKQALSAMDGTLGAIAELKAEFTPEERAKFVGVVRNPALRAAQVFKADPKFAKFQAIMGRIKKSAFDIGGKTFTETEKGIVFQSIPTGEENSAADFEAKLSGSEAAMGDLRQRRTELSTMTRGELSKQSQRAPSAPTRAGGFDELPDAKSAKGLTILDTKTGRRLRSDGTKWVPTR